MIRHMPPSIAAAILAATLLGACSDNPEPAPVRDEAGVAGDVLEGSISDEMLPLETLQSQPPLAADAETETGSAAADTAGAE